MSSDLLKEAIADAKAVRETALENAKMALEEAFTPQLKSMLSAKLKEEDLEEDEFYEGEHEDEDEAEEGMHDDDEAEEGRLSAGAHDDEEAEEGRHEEDEDDEVDESNIIEIDGVKYAPIVAEEDDDDEDAEEGMHEEDNLDLEAVIKELESELSEGEDDDEDDKEEGRGMKEEEEIEEEYEIDEAALTEKEDDDDDKDEVDEEVDTSSGIGKGTGKGSTDTSSGIGKGGQEKAKKMESIQSELDEYKEAVSYLKNKLHEVNLLNAKLLFTNKLFKEFTLDNSQKLKVVETFDRTQSTREIKLVYSTLAEQFSDNGSIKKKSIKESASSSVGSTKPSKESSKVITEEEAVANRFKKLAGLING